jgi:hypothetical protein
MRGPTPCPGRLPGMSGNESDDALAFWDSGLPIDLTSFGGDSIILNPRIPEVHSRRRERAAANAPQDALDAVAARHLPYSYFEPMDLPANEGFPEATCAPLHEPPATVDMMGQFGTVLDQMLNHEPERDSPRAPVLQFPVLVFHEGFYTVAEFPAHQTEHQEIQRSLAPERIQETFTTFVEVPFKAGEHTNYGSNGGHHPLPIARKGTAEDFQV